MRRTKLSLIRRIAVGLSTVAVVAAIAPFTASGAPPEIFHANFSDSAEDVDFCGVTVDLVNEGVFTAKAFFDQDGNFDRFMETVSARTTLTAENGKSVIIQAARNLVDAAPIINEQAGTITFALTFKGLPEKIQTGHGPVLLRDAGLATFLETFDLETGAFVSSDVIVKGPHPELDSDFTLFCDVISEALA